jgi:hypothetical protein
MNATAIDKENELVDLENKFNIVIPSDYREHLLNEDLNQKKCIVFLQKMEK